MDSSSSSNDSLLQLLAWLEKNKKKVAVITGGVLVVAGLVAGIIYYQGQKEVWASEALSEIHAPMNPSAALPAGTLQAYLKVAGDYAGTRAAGRALLEAAAILYNAGTYTDAEARFKQFLNDYPESPFQAQGMLGLASTLDAEHKATEAIAKYEELLRRFPSDSVADETKLALGRLQEKSNPAEAYKRYTELLSLGSQSGIAQEAGIRREDLVEKNPDIVKTNTPPTPVMPGPAKPSPQVSIVKTVGTNQVAVSSTNGQPTMTVTIPPPNKAATGAPPPAPLLVTPPPTTPKKP